MDSNIDVAIIKCTNYEEENIKNAFDELLPYIDNLDFIKSGLKVAIKANLVTFLKPEKAGTTHPNLLKELCRRLIQKGAEVTIGDSPGGPYNALNLNNVYKATGLVELKDLGVKLNDNFAQKTAKFPEGKALKEIPYTAYLDDADVIINFCKLKSHGMMGMSCAVKNLFGIIPGTIKPEFHFKYPDYSAFANMLIDLNEFLKPSICIVDGIMAMEGNGPTAGTPKYVGLILASKNQYKLDYVCAKIIGLEKENVPTIEESFKRGFVPEKVEEIKTNINIDDVLIKDFDLRKVHKSLWFNDESTLHGKMFKKALQSRPEVSKNECIGCEKCKNVCPAKAIHMENKKPVIDRKKCITCFCCQEFCPVGAMKVHRAFIARMINKF